MLEGGRPVGDEEPVAKTRGPGPIEVLFAFGFMSASIVNGLLIRGPVAESVTYGLLSMGFLTRSYGAALAKSLLETMAKGQR